MYLRGNWRITRFKIEPRPSAIFRILLIDPSTEHHYCYEFNLLGIQRTKIQSESKLLVGSAKIEVESRLVDRIGSSMDITLLVNGAEVAKENVPAAMSLHYCDQAPFTLNGTIGMTRIQYTQK